MNERVSELIIIASSSQTIRILRYFFNRNANGTKTMKIMRKSFFLSSFLLLLVKKNESFRNIRVQFKVRLHVSHDFSRKSVCIVNSLLRVVGFATTLLRNSIENFGTHSSIAQFVLMNASTKHKKEKTKTKKQSTRVHLQK